MSAFVSAHQNHPLTYLEVYEVDMNRMVPWTSSIDQSPTLDGALRRSRKYAIVDVVEINTVDRPYIILKC